MNTGPRALRKLIPYAAAVVALGAIAPATAGTLGVYTSGPEGFDTHTYWYDDGQEVTVIDTQFVPALTPAMIDKIQASTRSPITRVVVTHANPDKFNGLSVLHARGVESIASLRTTQAMPGVHAYKKYYFTQVAKTFTDATYPAFEPVRTTFTGRIEIRLKSGETLSLIELKNPGVALAQTVVRIDRTGDLIVGDLVHHKAHLWLEGGIEDARPRADLAGWKAALAELPLLAQGSVYGGRGAVGQVSEAVTEAVTYLERAESVVASHMQATSAADLKDPSKAAAQHAAIQRKLEGSFPTYGLSYLVGYSVYGLVSSMQR